MSVLSFEICYDTTIKKAFYSFVNNLNWFTISIGNIYSLVKQKVTSL